MGISALKPISSRFHPELGAFLKISLDVMMKLLFLRAEDAYHVLDT